jgi:hypothetical protein
VRAGVNGMWFMKVVMNSVNTSRAVDSDSDSGVRGLSL